MFEHDLPEFIPAEQGLGGKIKITNKGSQSAIFAKARDGLNPSDLWFLQALADRFGSNSFPRGNLDVGRINRLFIREIVAVKPHDFDPNSLEAELRVSSIGLRLLEAGRQVSQDNSGRLRESDVTAASSRHEAIPFEVGKLYHRQRDIHQIFGGQERSGIATPSRSPYVFLFTAEAGEQFGYSDGWRSDGLFAYTGEGQKGDMTFVRGNRAIRDHLTDGRDLLLFQATNTKGQYRFIGCFACAQWDLIDAPDGDNKQRKAITFSLAPIGLPEPEALSVPTGEEPQKSLAELRSEAISAASVPSGAPRTSNQTYYVRSAKVREYVLRRAGGRCEACKLEAPFLRADGTPYLEPHHILRVSDGGPDHPSHVGAICPNCHRLIHHGRDGMILNEALRQYVGRIEMEQEQ